MSAAVNATKTIASTQHDISQIVRSRKRKLQELYEITCSTEPTPRLLLVYSPDKPSQDNGLASFLDRNDIERGRYFQESTLPSRPTAHAQVRSSSTLTASSLNQAEVGSSVATKVDEKNFDDEALEVTLSEPHPHLSRKLLPDQPPVSRSNSEAPGLPPEQDVATSARLSASRVPRIDTGPNDQDQSLRKGRPSKLESPPLSPDHEVHAESLTAADGQAQPDVLTPRKEAYDIDATNKPLLEQEPHAVQSRNLDTSHPDDEAGAALPDSASSHSSVTGRRSTNTSRTGPQSPATSPDDEDEARSQRLIAPAVSDLTTLSHKTAKVSSGHSDRAVHAQTSSNGREPEHVESSPVDKDAVSPTTGAQKAQPISTVEKAQGKHFNEFQSQKSQARTKKEFNLSWTRRSERFRRHQGHIIAVTQQPRLSVEYYRPFVSREALNNQHSRSLQSLLENRAKVLSTVEREIGQREEAARLVLQRIKHLQDQGRWSLRSIKSSIEPDSQATFWDKLVEKARWLRTDFKEERKLKLSVAKMLAEWCAEYVLSDREDRHALSLRTATTNSRSLVADAASPAQIIGEPGVAVAYRLNAEKDVLNILETSSQALPFEGRCLRLDGKVLEQLPAYGEKTGRSHDPELSLAAQGFEDRSGDGRSESPLKQFVELPPDRDSCALFGEGGKPALRKKINVVIPFKPPNRVISPMPGQAFYETRAASQWTNEDDELLRHNIRQHSANWLLISQEMSSKSEFVPGSDRRTVWECFERYVTSETSPNDLASRPYLKPFYTRYSQARSHFDESQRVLQQQLQQARENGQNTPVIAPKAFPEPRRVDRKPSRRFMALLDAARRLARKRETAATKQERSQQNETRPQQNSAGATRIPHDPKFYHNKKYEQELKESAELQKYQEHRKALIAAQHKQQAGYPASLSHGIGQQMQNGMAGSTSAVNGHLAVPAMSRYPRPNQQQVNGSVSMANGISARPQVPVQGRPQTGVQSQRHMAQMSPESMAKYMQQQTAQQRFQNAQHSLQSQPAPQVGQVARASPNLHQELPNGGVPNSNENHVMGIAESYNSSNLQQGIKHQHSTSNSSNPTQQALAAATGHSYVGMNGNRPQALSNGQVPHVVALSHQIQNKNPGISQADATQQATEALKNFATQNAMSAASGMISPGQGQPLQHQRTSQAMQPGGSQSPYQQHAVPTPQMRSPFQHGGVLASNHVPQANHNVYSSGGISAQQQQYQTAMRKQMINQQMYQMTPGQNGQSITAGHSPHLGQAGFPPNSNTRTPGSMRPPSRSASGYEIPQHYPQHDLQRPGSAANAAQSPRPISAQGFGQT